jgi:hypothetical protein
MNTLNDTRSDEERFEDYQAELTARRRDALWRQLVRSRSLGRKLYRVEQCHDGPVLTDAQRERLQRKVRQVYGKPKPSRLWLIDWLALAVLAVLVLLIWALAAGALAL